MKKEPLYQVFARILEAQLNCSQSGNAEWEDKHRDAIERIMETAPSGLGLDNGVTFALQASTPEILVFTTSYHHMNDVGVYIGWTDHAITVRPSLAHGCTVSVSGQDKNGIKYFIHNVCSTWLFEEVCTNDFYKD